LTAGAAQTGVILVIDHEGERHWRHFHPRHLCTVARSPRQRRRRLAACALIFLLAFTALATAILAT
jgi:hypothetical protein